MSGDVILHHAGWALFAWVFVNQCGVPVPVVPSLLAAGALAGRRGPSYAVMLTAAVTAAVGADMAWYGVGRWRGALALRKLCRLLPWSHTCADHVEHVFRAHEVGFQFWAKFLPELNPIAAGLAGATGVALGRYIVIASATAIAWAGTWITVGYLLADVLGDVVTYLGIPILVLVALAVVALVAIRYARRRRPRTGLVKAGALVLVIASGLSGCASVGLNYTRLAIETASHWRTPSEGPGSLADLEWWQLFQDHQVHLVSRLATDNPSFQAQLSDMVHRLAAAGLGTWEAQRQAYARFYELVQGQAQTLAYIDTFWLLAVGAAVMFGLSFALDRRDPRVSGTVSVH